MVTRDTSLTTHQQNNPTPPDNFEDAISLIDLAKILIRRRYWLLGTGGGVIFLALMIALLNLKSSNTYEYISIYQVAEQEPGRALVNSEIIIQQVNSLYWVQSRRDFMRKHQIESRSQLPFTFAIENPSNTTLLRLVSNGQAQDREWILQLHQQIIERIQAEQDTAYKRQKQQLERQIASTNTLLERLEKSVTQAASDLAINASDRLFELESQLTNLSQGRTIEYAEQGEPVRSQGIGGKLTLALGVVLAGILGLMAAFLAEFVARVRQSLKEENKNSN